MFFWIIILSFVIPVGMRMYKRSVRGRNRDQGFSGPYPGQFPQQGHGRPGDQPRDGYTQQDYFGGFGQINDRQQPTPPGPFPVPGQQAYGQQGPGYGTPGYQGPVPFEDSPGYPANQYPGNSPAQERQQPAAPATPPPPSAPQGYRARKLAELDQQYSNGEIAMEDYMARRDEIMRG
ncbi:hypothetical protein [Arthrobacter sp. 92]|uniref:hypothetical protein n=1 Tax=Arthrobacter sp. 92 TaxID=3418175 RepID=UPI003D02E271